MQGACDVGHALPLVNSYSEVMDRNTPTRWARQVQTCIYCGKQVVPDTMTTPRYFPCTLPGNPANFRTENTVGQFRDTETIGMGFFGYVSRLYAGLECQRP